MYNMQEIGVIILYSFASGATIIIGGLLARFDVFHKGELHDEISHGVVAFGGGVLVAAVAFVLAPKGIEALSLFPLILIFALGSLFFLFLDRYIARQGGKAAQLMAMMMDFIPEAIALAAVFAYDNKAGLLLALFIGLQNLPESYNAFGDLRSSGFSRNKSMLILVPFSLVGVAAALAGYSLLAGQDKIIASLMLFAAGGILYLVFQDIAPMSKLKNRWTPAIGATIGFMLGMIGAKLLG
jgi:ZIP family zinc transporter